MRVLHFGAGLTLTFSVTDMAGNLAHSESQTPVMLDLTEPRASVIGITGMGKTH